MENTELQSTEDVSPESSPSTPESAAQESQAHASSQPSASPSETNKPNSDNLPFHEHPRFKEIIEERNTFKQQLAEMQRQLAESTKAREAAQPKELTPEQKFLARAKQIDPEFAQFNESVYSKLSKLEQLEQQYLQSQAEAQRQAVQTQLSSLHEQYKVPAEQRDIYHAMLKAHPEVSQAGVQDLPRLYKAVHDQISKVTEAIKRSTAASYVTDKKAAASVPATSTKAPAKPQAAKASPPMDRDALKADLIKRVVQDVRTGRGGV